jgi:preprotein translocase subunit YajC
MTISDVGSVFAMGATPDGGSPWLQFVPFAFVLAIFYFIILLPMKRKQQKVQQFLDTLKVNDRIVTTGGIYGQITRLGEQTVQVQIADKVRIEVAKAAIGGLQGQEPVQEPLGERASQ